MAGQAGYIMNRYRILGKGGHATTYRSDADLSWGMLAPSLLPRGCTPSALLHTWAAARTLAACSSSQPVSVSCPKLYVRWWLAAVSRPMLLPASSAYLRDDRAVLSVSLQGVPCDFPAGLRCTF